MIETEHATRGAPRESSSGLHLSSGRRNVGESKTGWLMSLPYALHLALFFGYPVAFSLVLVFVDWDVYTPMEFSGLDNMRRLLSDAVFYQSVRNTLKFLFIHVPLQIAGALFFALMLNRILRFKGFFRTLYFLPVVVSGVVITILFQQLFAFETGSVNRILNRVGVSSVPWLISERWAMTSIALMATWKNVGLYVVLFLAGLQTLPRSVYDAAELDGFSDWQQFRLITLPLLNPVMLTVVILSVIGGFSLFIEPYILTGGGPMDSTLSAILYIYEMAFGFGQMGYAATLGLVFAFVIFATVLIQRRFIEAEPYV